MRVALTLLLVFTIRFSAGDLMIAWQAERKLVWDDFKGWPDSGSPYVAITSYHISGAIEGGKDSLVFHIACSFDKKKSWVKISRADDKVLRHEQGHFDLGEVYARKLRKRISETRFQLKNVQSLFMKHYHAVEHECAATQALYDKETRHSEVTEKQAEWEKRIAAELYALEAFNDTLVVVHPANQ